MRAPRPKRVLLFANSAWNLYNFRRRLITALVAAGHDVVAVAPVDPAMPQLCALGCRTVPVAVDARGRSPLRDLALFGETLSLLARERPDVILTYTIKPNIYGTLAARLLGIPVIVTMTGLGTAFLAPGGAMRIARQLYRVALRSPHTVFFQNEDDRDLFVEDGLVAARRCALVPGSGVDLDRFRPVPLPPGPPTFLFIGRMLPEKGVGEFLEAARSVRARYPSARFQLLGPTCDGAAVADPAVQFLGAARDVRPFIARAHAVVLPSYREGTSRALLEAAAMGRPLIASDVPGCREAVEPGRNGLLCAPRSAAALAGALTEFLALPPRRWSEMGAQSRKLAGAQFDERLVVSRMLAAIESAMPVRYAAAAQVLPT